MPFTFQPVLWTLQQRPFEVPFWCFDVGMWYIEEIFQHTLKKKKRKELIKHIEYSYV